jgi:hypothetical protein
MLLCNVALQVSICCLARYTCNSRFCSQILWVAMFCDALARFLAVACVGPAVVRSSFGVKADVIAEPVSTDFRG